MNDLVSIIMPSYNTSSYIARSIQSVQNQKYKNWELLIVDDCSTDNTDEVVQSFVSDKRIKYLKNDYNKGAAASRNRALKEANGRWIAFLDSDDIWLSNKLSKQVCFMEKNGIHFSYTNYEEIDMDGNPNGVTVTGPSVITRKDFLKYCWPGCLTVMYDKEFIGLIQINNIKKNNDYAMWLKISCMADCYLLKESLALYRRGRTGSVSTESIATMIGWHYKLFHEAEGQNPMKASFNTAQNMLFGLYKKMHYTRRQNV